LKKDGGDKEGRRKIIERDREREREREMLEKKGREQDRIGRV
jgi:hypothetical protein